MNVAKAHHYRRRHKPGTGSYARRCSDNPRRRAPGWPPRCGQVSRVRGTTRPGVAGIGVVRETSAADDLVRSRGWTTNLQCIMEPTAAGLDPAARSAQVGRPKASVRWSGRALRETQDGLPDLPREGRCPPAGRTIMPDNSPINASDARELGRRQQPPAAPDGPRLRRRCARRRARTARTRRVPDVGRAPAISGFEPRTPCQ